MARKARDIAKSGIYHVILRGVNRMAIFHEEADFRYLLDRLKKQTLAEESSFGDEDLSHGPRCEIYAYCLMTNHLHLLVKELEEPIGSVIKRITSGYVIYFNHKYNRVGHLFQERFKSQTVENELYLLRLLIYIHQNPLKANMVKHVKDYPWSSWHELMEGSDDGICNKDRIFEIITPEELREIIEQPLSVKDEGEIIDYDSSEADDDSVKLLPEEVRKLLFDYSGASSPEDFLVLPKPFQRDCIGRIVSEGASPKDLPLLTGIPYSSVCRIAAKWKERNPPFVSEVRDEEWMDEYLEY